LANITFTDRLRTAIDRAGTPLCVGLDPDPTKIPAKFGRGAEGAYWFVTEMIEKLWQKVAAFKPNTAFFEAYGSGGWLALERLRINCPTDVLWIVDAKRGDIEHTNEVYARAIFEGLGADAITAQPYLGIEALEPFYRKPENGVFILCATSNQSASSIQNLPMGERELYLEIARQAKAANKHNNLGLVVGTTKPDALDKILSEAPELPLLLPGSGAQGGSASVMSKLKQTNTLGLLNVSRSVLYASSGDDHLDAALKEVERLRSEL
jgi:orotidine-5'-phosphate decarboxylase